MYELLKNHGKGGVSNIFPRNGAKVQKEGIVLGSTGGVFIEIKVLNYQSLFSELIKKVGLFLIVIVLGFY